MHEDQFENQLSHLRHESIPDCPGDLEENVLRKVRDQRRRSQRLETQGLLVSMLKPNIGFAALALAVIASAATTTVAMEYSDRSVDRAVRMAEKADPFQLEVFNHSDDLICCCK